MKFNKVLALFLVLTIAAVTVIPAYAAKSEQQKYVKGDVDCNGTLSSADALATLQYSVKGNNDKHVIDPTSEDYGKKRGNRFHDDRFETPTDCPEKPSDAPADRPENPFDAPSDRPEKPFATPTDRPDNNKKPNDHNGKDPFATPTDKHHWKNPFVSHTDTEDDDVNFAPWWANVTNDFDVTSADALLILQHVVNKVDRFENYLMPNEDGSFYVCESAPKNFVSLKWWEN